MKQTIIVLILSLLWLVGCTVEQPLPILAPIEQASETTSIPLTTVPTLTTTSPPTNIPMTPINTPFPPTNTPTPIPTITPTPTLRPTSTPVTLDPSLPLPTGRIYFLWDPNPIPEERGIGELSETSLFEAIPGTTPNDWHIESVVEMFGKPVMIPAPDAAKLAILRYDDTNEDGIVDTQRGSDTANVYSYNIANNSLTRLTENQWSPTSISWLPNAQSLTYPQLNDLYIVELDSPFRPRLFLNYSGYIYNHDWSPDGKYLTSLHAPSNQSGHPIGSTVFDLLNSESDSLMIISDSTTSPGKILWSPNSQWVAFSQHYGKGLLIVNVTTGEMNELIPPDSQVSSEWSSDAQRLAFTHGSTLFLWDANTEKIRQLINMDALSDPSWSPDGNYIAVGYADGEESGLLIIDPANDSQQRFNLGMTIGQIFWSPDGQWLLFSFGLDDRVGLYMVHRDGGIPFLFLETTGKEFPYAIFWLPIQ